MCITSLVEGNEETSVFLLGLLHAHTHVRTQTHTGHTTRLEIQYSHGHRQTLVTD